MKINDPKLVRRWNDVMEDIGCEHVTFGCRAGEMNAGGHISLPGGEQGEDKLAALGIAVSHEWMSGGAEEFSFDEFIEEVLLKHFPKED